MSGMGMGGMDAGCGASSSRACLKIAFRQLCVPLCGRFGPDEGGVAGYVDRIGTKSPAKWGVQMAGMNFQTRPEPSGTGAGQEAGAQTRALAFPMILISGSDKGRRPLSTASRRLRPARPCRCIHPSHPHSTHPLRFPTCSTS